MIPRVFIEKWSNIVNWQTPMQVEQDLIISRALVEIYNNDFLRGSLIFRGGTALSKLFLNPAVRFSEDIDLVQKFPEPIGNTVDIIREVLKPWLGDPKWKITKYSARLIYKYQSNDNYSAKLKIEINVDEHFQAMPLQLKNFRINSEWFSDCAQITTYNINELMATKLRALYQRRKGRDLFDLWYVIVAKLVDAKKVVSIFRQYCDFNGVSISRQSFISNLEEKKLNRDFRLDMNVLLLPKFNWNFEEAYDCVIDNFVNGLT